MHPTVDTVYQLLLISIRSQNNKGPWTPKLTYHFPKRAQFYQNFDCNIGTQRFANTKKLTFDINDLRKWRKKWDAVLTGWWCHRVYP